MDLLDILIRMNKEVEEILFSREEIPFENKKAFFELHLEKIFDSYSLEEQKEIEELLLKTKFPTIIKKMILDKDFSKSTNRLELIRLLSTKEQDFQVIYGKAVATSESVIQSGKVVELTTIVSKAEKKFQASCGSEVARNENAIASGVVVSLTEIVTAAEKVFQAEAGRDIATSKIAVESGKAVELTTIVSKAEKDFQARCGSEVARNKFSIASGEVVSLTKIVTTAEKVFQAQYGSYVATDINSIQSGKVVELTTIVSKAEKYFQAKWGSDTSRDDRTSTGTDKIVELTKIVATSEQDFQAQYGSYVAKHIDLLGKESIIELTKAFTTASSKQIVGDSFELLKAVFSNKENIHLFIEKPLTKEYVTQLKEYFANYKQKIPTPVVLKSEIDLLIEQFENCKTEKEENQILEQQKAKKLAL